MVLSDVHIRSEITEKRLVFDPPIDFQSDRIDRSAVDLLLHEELIILPKDTVAEVIVNPSVIANSTMDILVRYGKQHILTTNGPYQLMPHHLIIGKTLEYIQLPRHLAARIEGKSTLARFGLSVHVTAPTVIAGFEGRLYLEINNIGPFPVLLTTGMKIAQLILEHVIPPPSEPYQGRYQRQA